MITRLFLLFVCIHICLLHQAQIVKSGVPKPVILFSPDKKIKLQVALSKDGNVLYKVFYNTVPMLTSSALGLDVEGRNLSTGFYTLAKSSVALKKEWYNMRNAKRSHIIYSYNETSVSLQNKEETLKIQFRLSNNGIAFRYFIPVKDGVPVTVQKENTSFHFTPGTKSFLQPMSVAKSGWESANPAYEEHYEQNIPAGTAEKTNTGWVYPALFYKGKNWVVLTEAGMDGSYCASRLSARSPDGNYSLTFPDKREVISNQNPLLPYSDTSFYSPWRIIAVGSLKNIMESTLGTDLASPAQYPLSSCQPGQSSWSWIVSKDDFIVYDEQVKYIDFAAKMKWKYCLVDWNWDQKIGYDKIKQLANYAAAKNVGLLLWYNSAGDWNTVKGSPRDKMLTHESRIAEFTRLKEIGIKGVKIDFFGGDGRSVIQYYVDILKDAAAFGLLVNFHGATLPRGWARTYPHLMTTEAVRGFEMVTMSQDEADREAVQVATLPFTRNIYDPMDYTPMNLYKLENKNITRRTTPAFELAASVLLLSGIQHFAESPEGMNKMPGYVQTLLQQLPAYWDDVKFIEGFPGKYAVIARRSGSKWFIAGINASNGSRTFTINESILFSSEKIHLYSDAAAPVYIQQSAFKNGSAVTVPANGGFLIVAE